MPTKKSTPDRRCAVVLILSFGSLKVHMLFMNKALHSLCTSGARSHAKWADRIMYCYGAQMYVKHMCKNDDLMFCEMFGEPVREDHAPMKKCDQPGLEESPELGPDGIKKSQSLAGAVHWTVKQVVRYMRSTATCAIGFHTGVTYDEATFGSGLIWNDWMEVVYSTPTERVDVKAPVQTGNMVLTTLFVDAKLMHDMFTGRSCTWIPEFKKQTPVVRQATERNLRYKLQLFEVPLDGPKWMFGDNKSVVTSSTIPHSALGKCWNALSYHCVHKVVAGGWLKFEHIPGNENPADPLTKAWPWPVSCKYIELLLLWKGDTAEAPSGHVNPEGSVKYPGPHTDQGQTATEVRRHRQQLDKPFSVGMERGHASTGFHALRTGAQL